MARPWRKDRYADNPSVLSTAGVGQHLQRISVKDVTLAQFIERFEGPRIPCIVTDAMEVGSPRTHCDGSCWRFGGNAVNTTCILTWRFASILLPSCTAGV